VARLGKAGCDDWPRGVERGAAIGGWTFATVRQRQGAGPDGAAQPAPRWPL